MAEMHANGVSVAQKTLRELIPDPEGSSGPQKLVHLNAKLAGPAAIMWKEILRKGIDGWNEHNASAILRLAIAQFVALSIVRESGATIQVTNTDGTRDEYMEAVLMRDKWV